MGQDSMLVLMYQSEDHGHSHVNILLVLCNILCMHSITYKTPKTILTNYEWYVWSEECDCIPGGGGTSMGRLWKVIRIQRDPETGRVALPVIRPESSSAQHGHFFLGFRFDAMAGSLNPCLSPS